MFGEWDVEFFVGGNGIIGFVFMDNCEYWKWIRDVFNVEVIEMELVVIG